MHISPSQRRVAGLVTAIGVALSASTALSAADAAPATTAAATKSGQVIPFTKASLAQNTTGHWVARFRAPACAGSVTVYTGTSATHFAKKGIKVKKSHGKVRVRTTAARPWVKLVPSHGAPLEIASRDLGLASDPNLRDAGGYRTASGQWVRDGVLYRSAALALSTTDQAAVARLGLTDDYDLRPTSEAQATPDAVPARTTYRHLNVMGDGSSVATMPDLSSAKGRAADDEAGRGLLRRRRHREEGVKKLYTDIAKQKGAGLYHCTAGKDRTGWASAALLTYLGVPAKTVMRDYLLSNAYYLHSPAVQAEHAAMPADQAAVYRPMLSVRASYLRAGLKRVKKECGSMDTYFTKGLHLSKKTLTKLRKKLRVGAAH